MYLHQHTGIEGKWLPFLAFFLVFIGVAFLIRWLAKLLKSALSVVLLGWVDRLGGMLFYILLYMMIFSLILFFATQLKLISREAQVTSNTYLIIEPWGPWVINSIGKVVPYFKDIFSDLKDFFGGVANSHA